MFVALFQERVGDLEGTQRFQVVWGQRHGGAWCTQDVGCIPALLPASDLGQQCSWSKELFLQIIGWMVV